jgi:hypothetical protein
MRHRDPHDDAPAKRRPDAYRGPPVTLGDIRAHGVRRLLIYCSEGLNCHHSTTVEADRWPAKPPFGICVRKRCAPDAGLSARTCGRIGPSGRGRRA